MYSNLSKMVRIIKVGEIIICVQRLPKLDLFKFTWRMGKTSIGVKYLREFEDDEDVQYELILINTMVTFRAWDSNRREILDSLSNIEFMDTVRENIIINASNSYTYMDVGAHHMAWFILHDGQYVRIGSIMKSVYKYKKTYYMVNDNGMIEECVTRMIPEGFEPEFIEDKLLFEIDNPPKFSTEDGVNFVGAISGPVGSIILDGAVYYLEFYNYELRLINRKGEISAIIRIE